MNLNKDIWTKIIACCNTKSKKTLGKSCKTLHELYSKNNIDIYLQSPLNLTQRQKEYALAYCTYKNCIPAVKNLLHHNAQTNYVYCGMDTTPLGIAKYNNNHELINLFKDNDKNSFEHAYFTGEIVPCALAAYMGDVEILREYVKSDSYNPLYENKDTRWEGSTLLYPAIFNGHRKVVELLLTHKKTITFINSGLKFSGRPIDIALMHGHTDIVKQLLAINSIILSNRNCAQKLYYCTQRGYTGCVKIILKRNKKSSCINKLTYDTLSYIPHKMDTKPLYHFFYWACPLTVAAFHGYTNIVKLLLKCKKIDVNGSLNTHNDLTPLYAASINGNTTIVKQLLQCPSIDPLLYTSNYTALHIACKNGHLKTAQLLITHSPQLLLMKTKNTKESPLQVAQDYNHSKIIKLLS